LASALGSRALLAGSPERGAAAVAAQQRARGWQQHQGLIGLTEAQIDQRRQAAQTTPLLDLPAMGSILWSLGLGEMGRNQVEAVANPGHGQLIGQPLRIAAQLTQDLLLLLGVAQVIDLIVFAGVKLNCC